ncbi:MAG: YceI family protein [Pseudomonadota bacterium]
MTLLSKSLRNTALAALIGAAGLSLPANAANYAIDPVHTSIGFKIGHLGFAFLTGRFDTFEGNYSFDADAPGQSQVSVKIDTASVNTNFTERDNHLRSNDFLAVGDFPEATFVSKSIEVTGEETGIITGDLTLRGVTREVAIEAAFVGAGEDPWGGHRSGFQGSTKIALADYGIDFDLGPSGREVELILNIEGIRQ